MESGGDRERHTLLQHPPLACGRETLKVKGKSRQPVGIMIRMVMMMS